MTTLSPSTPIEPPVVYETDFGFLPLHSRGKVRDIYDLGDSLLIIATDRVSAFDVVSPTPIPGKGRVLTQMSLFWFDRLKGIVPNHVLVRDANAIARQVSRMAPDFVAALDERAMLVKKAEPIPIECVVRGYISGSAWQEYRQAGTVCGAELPPGLVEAQKLHAPIFTPATKSAKGHDENIPVSQMADRVGSELTQEIVAASLALYREAAEYALMKGIIIADTKFEFGLADQELILIDEVFTPDSSRFWDSKVYEPGHSQPSFDKQPLRDYLDSIGWDRQPPAPELPTEVVKATTARYEEVYRRLVPS
jgi:phosphoribosylaminoimidazole-succinocarboxamide synthase